MSFFNFQCSFFPYSYFDGQYAVMNYIFQKNNCQTPVPSPDFSLGLGVDFVLPLSQEQQEQEQQPSPKISAVTDRILMKL